jgi:hypothetical protein
VIEVLGNNFDGVKIIIYSKIILILKLRIR